MVVGFVEFWSCEWGKRSSTNVLNIVKPEHQYFGIEYDRIRKSGAARLKTIWKVQPVPRNDLHLQINCWTDPYGDVEPTANHGLSGIAPALRPAVRVSNP